MANGKIEQLHQKKLDICREYFNKAKKVGCKFRRSDLKRLSSQIDSKADLNGISEILEYNYTGSVELKDDSLYLINPIKEAVYRENYFLKLLPKSEDPYGVSISVPLVFK